MKIIFQHHSSNVELHLCLSHPPFLQIHKHHKKSFFDISIYENTEIVTDPKKKILNLTFVVDKKEWLKTSMNILYNTYNRTN